MDSAVVYLLIIGVQRPSCRSRLCSAIPISLNTPPVRRQTMKNFDEIRPYSDAEAVQALYRVVADDEFLGLLLAMRYPRLADSLGWLLKPLLRIYLRFRLRSISSVDDIQAIVARYLGDMLSATSDGLSVTGIEQLDFSSPYLFLSNHRDITLDPALTNYAIYQHGGSTLRIAIGDNLLQKPFATDLMRANKAFIVKRSLTRPREVLKALSTLSAYVWHSLHVDRENVWIAHREGRAKDGFDKTEPAIIKMLTIAKPKTMPFSEYVKQLRIVPVAISYQYDPCDADKARELRELATSGSYTKSAHEDLESIGKGIAGVKGKIHLSFGTALGSGFEAPEDVASELDRQIVGMYELQSSNLLAYELLNGPESLVSLVDAGLISAAASHIDSVDRENFLQRLAHMPDEDTPYALTMYANPVVNLLAERGIDASMLAKG